MTSFITRNIQALWQIKFVREVLTLQAGGFFSTGLAFIKSVFFARLLGLEGFGVYATVLAFAGTLNLLTNLGQGEATLTFFADRYNAKDDDGMRTVMRYYLKLTVVGVSMYLLFIAFAPLIAGLFYDNPAIAQYARIMFLGFLVGALNNLFIVIFQCVREIKRMTIFENLNSLLQLLLSLLFFGLGFHILSPFLGFFVTNVIMLILYLHQHRLMRERYQLPALRSALRGTGSIRTYLSQGIWIALDKNIAKLFPQGYLFVLSIFAPVHVVGLAQLAYKIGSLPTSLLLPHTVRMALSILPALEKQGGKVVRQTCAKLMKHAVAFHLLLSIGGLIVLPYLALLFYGLEYSDVITPLLWLIIANFVQPLFVLNSPVLRLRKKTHVPALYNALTTPLLLALFVGLLGVFSALTAFVLIVAIRLLINFVVTGYVWNLLRQIGTTSPQPA